MSIPPKILFSFLLFTLPSVTGSAQRYLGIATSDWDAINSVYLNPANIAGCREKFSISIFSLNLAVDNNLGHLPSLGNIGSVTDGNNNFFTNSGKNKFSMMVPQAKVRGPGIMVSITKKISVALTTDIRAINQFNNFDPELYTTLSNTGFVASKDYNVKMQNFNWTAHMWSEIGLTFAATVSENDHGRLNLGITVRRLGGIGYVSIVGKNMDMSFKAGNDSFYSANSDIDFASNVINDSSAVFKRITPSGLFDKFFDESAGGGLSTDIGFTYRYRIGEADRAEYMESDDTHDLIFSAAVTDFGAINYFNSSNADLNITGNGYLSGFGINSNASNTSSVVAYAQHQGFGVDTETRSRKVYLPASLVVSGDVQIYGRFCANLMYIANLADRLNFGNSYYNQISLTPRYDFHKMTISLPLTYSFLADDFKMGFAVRYSGFFIGSDDMLAAFSKCQYGFGVYFGGYIPIFYKHNIW